MIWKNQNNKEYEEVKENFPKDVEEVESSQKANSNANATPIDYIPKPLTPNDNNNESLVNSVAFQNVEDNNKSDKDDKVSSLSSKVVSIRNSSKESNIKSKEEINEVVAQEVDESKSLDVEMIDEPDQLENNVSDLHQNEIIESIEVKNEEELADEHLIYKDEISICMNNIANKPNHVKANTRRPKGVKKAAAVSKEESKQVETVVDDGIEDKDLSANIGMLLVLFYSFISPKIVKIK